MQQTVNIEFENGTLTIGSRASCADHPTVFISYSHDDDAHTNWVARLAAILREKAGVDAILDRFELRIGDDLGFFMEQGLSDSKLVICICSTKYCEKANHGVGGAGYEKMIMSQELLTNANANYIIPIIRNNPDRKRPSFLRSKSYIDFNDDKEFYDKYRELVDRIYDQDVAKRPSIGKNPFKNDMSKQVAIKTAIEDARYISPELSGNVVFQFENNNGHYQLGIGEYSFDTRWDRADNDSVHAYGTLGYNSSVTDFPDFEEIIKFDFSSTVRTIRKGQITIFTNSSGKFAAVKMGSVKSSLHGYPVDEMEFEYRIY